MLLDWSRSHYHNFIYCHLFLRSWTTFFKLSSISWCTYLVISYMQLSWPRNVVLWCYAFSYLQFWQHYSLTTTWSGSQYACYQLQPSLRGQGNKCWLLPCSVHRMRLQPLALAEYLKDTEFTWNRRLTCHRGWTCRKIYIRWRIVWHLSYTKFKLQADTEKATCLELLQHSGTKRHTLTWVGIFSLQRKSFFKHSSKHDCFVFQPSEITHAEVFNV